MLSSLGETNSITLVAANGQCPKCYKRVAFSMPFHVLAAQGDSEAVAAFFKLLRERDGSGTVHDEAFGFKN
jgi:hypothetical protein